jgi:hypothetical protein
MTTSTIPLRRQKIVRHGPSSLRLCTTLVHRRGKHQFLAITQAGKVVIDRVGLDVVVIRVGDAAEDSRFSLGDPSL